MMKHIYIFIAVTRGVNYGIGTYIDVLLMSLRSCKLKVTIVELDSFISEVRIVDYKSYRAIKIPYSRWPQAPASRRGRRPLQSL